MSEFFPPAAQEQLSQKFREVETLACPFANLPERRAGRWGQGLTAAKMAECRWLQPALVGQFDFVERTPDDHLRHSHFAALREDKRPQDIRRGPLAQEGSPGPAAYRRASGLSVMPEILPRDAGAEMTAVTTRE